MEQETKDPNEEDPGRELLQQLTELLRQRNRPHRLGFLDRPIAITLIGVVFVGVLTTGWQMSEQRQNLSLADQRQRRNLDLDYQRRLTDQRFQLLGEFPTVYETRGNLLNYWIQNIIWLAEEENKCGGKRNEKVIREEWSVIKHLEDEFYKAKAIDSLLIVASVEFNTQEVHIAAEKMQRQWQKFEDLLTETNSARNVTLSVSCLDLKRLEAKRIATRKATDSIEGELTKSMAVELWTSKLSLR